MGDLEYTHRITKRAKRMLVTIYADGHIVVTTPRPVREETLERFLRAKQEWILETQEKLKKKTEKSFLQKPHTKVEITNYTEEAHALAAARLAHFAELYRSVHDIHLSHNSITIRNQKTRWGSCSRTRSLSFNYRIACIPPALADYIIVHELCHTKEMNHSPKFWKLVEKTIPDYAARRRALRAL
jgi:predicted metal-dependent hydrolase